MHRKTLAEPWLFFYVTHENCAYVDFIENFNQIISPESYLIQSEYQANSESINTYGYAELYELHKQFNKQSWNKFLSPQTSCRTVCKSFCIQMHHCNALDFGWFTSRKHNLSGLFDRQSGDANYQVTLLSKPKDEKFNSLPALDSQSYFSVD